MMLKINDLIVEQKITFYTMVRHTNKQAMHPSAITLIHLSTIFDSISVQIYEPFYFFAGFLVIAKYLENGSILV